MVEIDELKKYSLFGGLLDQDLSAVLPFLRSERFPAGSEIIREGAHGDRLYFILDGRVEILKDTPGGARRIAELITGDTFGEMELIDIQPRTASVRALIDTTTLSLSNKDMLHIKRGNLETFTVIVMNLARDISRRLRTMDALVAAQRPLP